jgi:hypothetical protein
MVILGVDARIAVDGKTSMASESRFPNCACHGRTPVNQTTPFPSRLYDLTVSCPTASPLLVDGARPALTQAWRDYPHIYDQVLEEVHARVNSAGYATKLDLAAVVAWKHVQTVEWMRKLLMFTPLGGQHRTRAAFAPSRTDRERIDALNGIPGFGSGDASTSALFAAWRPTKFGVYDRRAGSVGWPRVVNLSCQCDRSDLVAFFEHLRQIANELSHGWTPRDVDVALYVLRSPGNHLAHAD